MSLLPFNIIYDGVDISEIDEAIKNIQDLHLKYAQQSIAIINNPKLITIAYPYDIDDDNFGLKNAFGNEIDRITAYSLNKTDFILDTIEFPASKSEYSNIYNTLTLFVQLDKEVPYLFPLFNDLRNYRALDKKFLDRYEYIINTTLGVKTSPISGTVTDIDGSQIKIENDGESVTITANPDYICVQVNDEIKKGDLLEKYANVKVDNGLIIEVNYSQADISKIEFLTKVNTKINIVKQN